MTNLPDNANWMQNHLSSLANRTLGRVTLPASHDSAMYSVDMNHLQVSLKWSVDITPNQWPLPNFHKKGTFDHETISSISHQIVPIVATALPLALKPFALWLGPDLVKDLINSFIKDLAVNLAKTQERRIGDQLSYGVRYFDLRPKKIDDYWCIHHSQDLQFKKRLNQDFTIELSSVSATGPSLDEVLGDVAGFMKNHNELVILNFSHYKALNMKSDRFKDFDAGCYKTLIQKIKVHLDPWLYTDLPKGKRLADVSIGDYLAEQGRVIVVCSGHYPVDNPEKGIWAMQDCGGSDISNSLRCFDEYSDTDNVETMKQKQFRKYEDFGADDPKQEAPCDLFLLSWTLTKQGDWQNGSVRDLAFEANRIFPSAMKELTVPNSHGRRPNMLSLDFVGPDTGVIEAAIELNEKE